MSTTDPTDIARQQWEPVGMTPEEAGTVIAEAIDAASAAGHMLNISACDCGSDVRRQPCVGLRSGRVQRNPSNYLLVTTMAVPDDD